MYWLLNYYDVAINAKCIVDALLPWPYYSLQINLWSHRHVDFSLTWLHLVGFLLLLLVLHCHIIICVLLMLLVMEVQGLNKFNLVVHPLNALHCQMKIIMRCCGVESTVVVFPDFEKLTGGYVISCKMMVDFFVHQNSDTPKEESFSCQLLLHFQQIVNEVQNMLFPGRRNVPSPPLHAINDIWVVRRKW